MSAEACKPRSSKTRRSASSPNVLLLQRLPVLALVVGAVFAGADRRPPLLVLAVPVHGPLDPLVESDGRLPAERFEARRGQRVAAVVPGAVLDVFDQRLVAVGERQDPPDHLDVGQLVGTASVVDVARLPLL